MAVRPSDEAGVAATLRLANERRIPVVPRGGGSGSQGGAVPVDMIELECNPGSASGDLDPQIEVRSSRDGGHTFGMYRTASLGAQGERRKRPRWRRFGFFDAPGALFDFRLTDACPLRVSAVLVNEPASGRSR